MTTDPDDAKKSAVSSADGVARRRADRRRRLDAVFGNVLPDVTSDESDESHTGRSKDWFEAQRPPHYE